MSSRLALNSWAQEILQVSDDPSQLEPSSGYMWRLQFICTMLRLGHLGEHIPARCACKAELESLLLFQEASVCFGVGMPFLGDVRILSLPSLSICSVLSLALRILHALGLSLVLPDESSRLA